ncbi:MAG: S-layer homology domain-containing protein [Ruminococcaceae bacterium]|nr:S-layer homology domain-containing protein [Oscillospiraceae bacterium]
MKKLSLVLIVLMLVLSSFAVYADSVEFESDYLGEGDFVLASFHAVKNFTAEDRDITPLEDACYWLGENVARFNIKYTSFIGSMSNGSRYTYNNWSIPNNRTNDKQGLIDMAFGDPRHIDEFKRLKNTTAILTDCGLPFGVTASKAEYVSNALYRDSLLDTTFEITDFTKDCEVVDFVDFNPTNYYTVIESNGQKYIIFQLEAYPRRTVCEWVSATLADNPDKRAIVYTHSFLAKEGEMYTQHSWALSQTEWLKIYGSFNTTIRENLLNIDQPHEGDQLWADALAAHDNVLCVISSNATVGKEIVTKVHKNNNGYDVLFVVADLIGGHGAEGNAFPVMMKISADNKTIDLRYVEPYFNKVGGYVEESKKVINLNVASLPEPDPVTVLPKIPFQYNGANSAYINGYEGNVFKPGNNMTKAEACTIFARLLLGTQDIPAGYTTRFTDVKEGDWFYNAIAYLDQTGYFYTIEGDKYNPNANITRAEFVELAYLTCILSNTKNVKFKDVDESNKYYKAIMAAAASGLVNGYADGTFGPDKTITRAEVVTVINRVLGLLANDTTVSKTNLERVFGDISGHWAEYQILMASNSNAKAATEFKKSVTETKNTLEFETNHVKVVINRKGFKVAEIINKETGKNVLANSATPAFAYLISSNGANIAPLDAGLAEDGRIVVNFKGGYKAYFIVETFDDIFTVELASNLPSVLKGASFGNLAINEEYNTNPDSYRLCSLLMNTNTNTSNSANGSSKATGGSTYTFVPQTMGAKLGITFGKYENIREQLKRISDAIDPAVGLTSTAGGPYALDNHDLFKDYVIMSSGIDQSNVEEVSSLASKYSVGQIDIHQGGSTFIQASFDFRCALTDEEKNSKKHVWGTGAMFKERIADVAHANGVQLGLHTYSSLVPTSATDILSNPQWQMDFTFADTIYTLRGKLTKGRTNIKTNEDASGFKVLEGNIPWNGPWTKYILIDEEIILVQQGTSSGFLNVKRGQCGTKPAAHEDGAEIRQFLCHYGMFQPRVGSELFWHIADRTAQAYNEGDFDMIYLDGFESFARDSMSKSEERYYYYAEFARRIVSQCIKKPIMEYSSGAPTYLWNARGRGGATDSARRAYKQHKINHRGVNMSYYNNFYTSTFGWFHFNPDVTTEFKNTLVKTMFRDDLDNTGALAIAWDISTVNDSFTPTTMAQKRSEDNFAYYTVYSLLRLNGYFSPEVKEQLKAGKYEHKVFRQDDGTWAFKEMKYSFNRILDMNDDLFISGSDMNPFAEQTPYVRIEQRYSTKGEDEVVVLALDENAAVSTLAKKHSFPEVNISDKITLKVKVFGNGSATDAILIQLGSVVTSETGRNDYVIPLNFTGWREFILADADNADYGPYTFSGTAHASQLSYETFRAVPSMSRVNSFTIKLCGECTGVKIDDIRAAKTVDAPVKNPSVTVGSSTITFNTELHSGEFIEFYPETGKAYQTYYEEVYNEETGKYVSDTAHVKEVTYTGKLTVPNGPFTYTYGAEALTDAPTRARVGIGLSGAVITNPEGWEAPEVKIPEEFITYEIG